MATPKKKVKFLVDVEVLNHLGEIDFTAKAGEVKELSYASAKRWLNRNKAESVMDKKPSVEKIVSKSVSAKKDEPKKVQSKKA